MRGQMVHIEFPADDIGQSEAFWSSLFGWEFQQAPGMSGYNMARITDNSGIAITSMEPGKRGARTYFDVDDIEAEVARISELGGQTSAAMPVPGMGWFATCSDPHGNEFGLWQNDENAPAPA